MKRSSILPPLALALSLCACGARTGLRVPDAPPLQMPECSTTISTLPFTLTTNPGAPPTSQITAVDWHIGRRCCNPDPQSPTGGGVLFLGCDVHQPLGQTQDTTWGGDCTGPAGSAGNPVWHVSDPNPSTMSFNMVGTAQGNVCVTVEVTFANGQRVSFGPRTWTRRDADMTPILYMAQNDGSGNNEITLGGPSAPGCATTCR